MRISANAARAKDGRTMYRYATATTDERSTLSLFQRVKAHAEIETKENSIPAFIGKTRINRRERLKRDGTNLSDCVNRFELPPLGKLANLERGEWEAFWDWHSKPGDSRVPGSESELDDSDDDKESSKHNSRECNTMD